MAATRFVRRLLSSAPRLGSRWPASCCRSGICGTVTSVLAAPLQTPPTKRPEDLPLVRPRGGEHSRKSALESAEQREFAGHGGCGGVWVCVWGAAAHNMTLDSTQATMDGAAGLQGEVKQTKAAVSPPQPIPSSCLCGSSLRSQSVPAGKAKTM